MKKESVCCCLSLIPSRDTVRFYLLGVLIALYMLAGAAIFSSLERPAELQAHQLWEKRLKDFIREHKVSREDLKKLLRHYEEGRTAGIRTDGGRALWDMSGAFYFVGTVVSTIGFGVTAPSTVTGKVLLVFYGLLGCSATLLFFNLFLERVITFLSLQIFWCHRRRSRDSGAAEGRAREGKRNEEWKPSVYHVTLVLLVVVLLVACGAASIYAAMEGWNYFESLYFCFVAFSTVGFGDFVSGQREHHEDTWAYQVANCLLMLLGVCCTYSLFNAISVILKQGLDRMLRTLARMYRGICHFRLQLRLLFKLTYSDSETTLCYSEDDTLHRKQLQTVPSSAHSMPWRSRAPSAIGKCLCDEAEVETVCHFDYDRTEKGQDINSYENNVVYIRPLPTCVD
ncbi:potassium channel subfamily K member 13 [Hippoglossus hippoglossus]|uniref:potassium channel subfamily K member 13 n=1 Tax=Hippoglossus hippoglossus TaxID=8267 RepID=UPI00148B5707|nr:potassium channel subfamily K member 13 [Hippoglossus hippoglossus]